MKALLWLSLLGLAACASDHRRDFFVQTSDGADLKVTIRGQLDSDTLILVLHGGPRGSSWTYAQGAGAAGLEARYAVAYLDQRGQGASQGHISTIAYGLQRAADDVYEVLQVLRSRFGDDLKLHLYGHSWGGTLGTMTLLNTPAQDLVDGWIEVSGCHDSILEPRYVEAQLREVAAVEIAAGRHESDWQSTLSWLDDFDTDADELDRTKVYQMNQLGYHAQSWVELAKEDSDYPSAFDFYSDGTRNLLDPWVGNRSLATLGTEWQENHPTPRLAEITLPAIYLYAHYDFVCPIPLGQDAVAANPNGELVIFEESGHSIMVNEVQKYVDTITGFVDGQN